MTGERNLYERVWGEPAPINVEVYPPNRVEPSHFAAAAYSTVSVPAAKSRIENWKEQSHKSRGNGGGNLEQRIERMERTLSEMLREFERDLFNSLSHAEVQIEDRVHAEVTARIAKVAVHLSDRFNILSSAIENLQRDVNHVVKLLERSSSTTGLFNR
jgi:hypothetical protein